ncbi:MAG: TIGR00366 family protein [Myxococcales bacterium]|nr:TIGR00366 family protein [Polyangiaceae bacterium]MDW8247740.1 TIGR00366 family protein [Myxococcales bacterium]
MAGAELPSSLGGASAGGPAPTGEPRNAVERVASVFTRWAERWIPDAFVFALVATGLVVGAAVLSGRAGVGQVLRAWGDGFWELLPFTLQMVLVIITGYVLATTRLVYRGITWLASLPSEPRRAVAMVTLLAMLSSWFNWGFSLIFGAMLAREVARRVVGVDYRAVTAASFLGLGSIWAQGLSGSAALQMATAGALPPTIRAIVEGKGQIPGGIIPLSSTIFLWQSLVSVVVEVVVVTGVMFLATPPASRALTAEQMGISLGESPLERPEPARHGTPSEWLEHSSLLSLFFVVCSCAYLILYFAASDRPLNALNLNTLNLIFLTLGFLLHGTPARLMQAVREATPGVWGVILQFPLYAGIASVITRTHLSQSIADAFVKIATPESFPAVIAIYSAVLGIFVPSGGSKWVIEAPYVMQAAHDLKVHLGWMVAVYDLGEAVANLIQPFWMLPILGLFGLRARDVMGYTFLVFLVLTPLVLVLVTILGATLRYPM